jgi:transposase-like protein
VVLVLACDVDEEKNMRRHGNRQIASKLRLARELAAQGQTQAEFCKELGISVMTFHRWRKMVPESSPPIEAVSAPLDDAELGGPKTNRELLDENRRLKRIITDLLLDKTKLEEMIEARSLDRRRGS